MGIMGFLRDRMGKILAIVIGLALFAFIVGEVVKEGSSFFRDSTTDIGEAAGQKIPYAKFNAALGETTKNLAQQSGGEVSPQLTNYAQESTWNQLVSQAILEKEIEKLGLTVGDIESKDMIRGNNPDPQIVRQFSDPQTGQFDRSRLDNFLSYVASSKADSTTKLQWKNFGVQLLEAKITQKYLAMIQNGLYINSLDAKDDYEAKNKLVKFQYATLSYASIADNKVTPTEDDYSNYYNEHKALFKSPQESRSFEYVTFNASPSKEDSAAVKEQAQKLVADFKTSTDDSTFVQLNAESKSPIIFQRKGQLEPKLDTVMFKAEKGFVYGPYLSNGSYKIAKLIDERMSPDSVHASHILLNPGALGPEKTMKLADSLKNLIAGGKSFAELAKQYSTDKGSAEKGGDLGTFGRGAMIPVFEDAAFNGKKGDLKIVTSQYGIHIIQVGDQKGSSKVVKVGIVDKPIQASAKTQGIAFSKAKTFLASLTKDNFDDEIKKENLQRKVAEDAKAISSSLPGLDNAREIVRWVFKSDKGDFSDEVFTVGDQYVVARVTAINPEGTLPLAAVKKQIEPAVINKVKAKLLIDKLQSASAGATTVDQVAQKAGTKAVPVENVVFANPVLPGLSTEYALVGSIFGSQLHKLSKPIEGTAGVYVFTVDSFTSPAPLTNTLREKQQLAQTLLQRADGQVFDALKDKANVKDNRAKFL